uniref:UDP-glycosyltransferase n=1 Tax=Polyphagotarsonemus latus TaxID=1204166 RepID=A0AAN0LHH8_9ACAR
MSGKKKLAFYSILESGHLNLCSSIGSILLNKYSNDVEIYFFTDQLWAEKLSKRDSRFKFEIFGYETKEQENLIEIMINAMESIINLPEIDRVKAMVSFFNNPSEFAYIDQEVSKLIKKLKPDYLLCDLIGVMPSIIENKIPYSFIISGNPLVLDIEKFPVMGLGLGVNEKEKIKAVRTELKESFEQIRKNLYKIYDLRKIIFDSKYPINVPRSDHLSIYCYPKELDYFNDDLKKEYKLLQVDSPVVSSKIPLPFELPKKFSELPGKIIYVSLGSIFSCYFTKLQKLLDTLATLPYKYIVSKGPYGDKITFPDNRFIGENFVNQLAILQVVDMIIAHGGNNTFTECFYFGVPALIFPILGDQPNNAKRIEETGYGYQMDLMNYTQEELKEKIEKVFSSETLIEKNKKVGERIRKDDSLDKAVEIFYSYFNQIID